MIEIDLFLTALYASVNDFFATQPIERRRGPTGKLTESEAVTLLSERGQSIKRCMETTPSPKHRRWLKGGGGQSAGGATGHCRASGLR